MKIQHQILGSAPRPCSAPRNELRNCRRGRNRGFLALATAGASIERTSRLVKAGVAGQRIYGALLPSSPAMADLLGNRINEVRGDVEPWRRYQHEVAAFYRELGMTAEVDVRGVQGARGRHDIDVLVQSRSGGMTVRWIIECKQWRRPVPKERVLALQAIVADVGADRGILVAESGFQAGAYRAAQNTSVVLTSLSDLRENTSSERTSAELSGLAARSARVSRRVSDLWPWATPLVASGPFDVEEMLEVAGPSFEVQCLILPKLLTPSGPIVVADAGRFLSFDDAREATQELLKKTERGLGLLEERLGAHYEMVKELIGRLRVNAEAFIAIGSSLATESDGKRAVEAMRGLSDAADRLIATTPVEVTKAVRKVMRQFVDVVYLLPEQCASPERWASESENVQQLIGEVDARLAAAAGKRREVDEQSQG